MSRRRRPNPLQLGIFTDLPAPPRGPGQRKRLKMRWNESGRGDAEDQAETLRGLLIDRLDRKLDAFMELFQDEFGLRSDQSLAAFQRVQETLFPEAFDIDLDAEMRKQGILPRCGGDKVTVTQLAALVRQLRPA
jgi:hypothetical protein